MPMVGRSANASVGMTCASCAATIERTLQSRVPGVVSASVNFATEKAVVEVVAGTAGWKELARAIEAAGYGVVDAAPGEMEDAEAAARRAEILDQTRKFRVGVALAVPRGTKELHVSARLMYRKADQYLLNFLFGKESGLTAPVTVMSHDEKTIQVLQ